MFLYVSNHHNWLSSVILEKYNHVHISLHRHFRVYTQLLGSSSLDALGILTHIWSKFWLLMLPWYADTQQCICKANIYWLISFIHFVFASKDLHYTNSFKCWFYYLWLLHFRLFVIDPLCFISFHFVLFRFTLIEYNISCEKDYFKWIKLQW